MEPMTNPEAQTASGGARLKKGSAKTPLIVLGVTVAVLAAGYLGLCAFALHHSTIWQETFVLGVNIGGMTEEEATQAVSNALPDMQISLYLYPDGGDLPDTAVQTPDAQIPLSDLDAQIDVTALVQGADAAQRSGSFFTAGWRYLAGHSMSYAGNPEDIQVDTAAASAAAESTAAALTWEAQDTSYTVTEDSLEVTLAKDGRTVDAAALTEQLVQSAWNPELTLPVPYTTTAAGCRPARRDGLHSRPGGDACRHGRRTGRGPLPGCTGRMPHPRLRHFRPDQQRQALLRRLQRRGAQQR